jgi:hypothetical protein
MGSNFGIGFGGFANGFLRGMEAGKQLREAWQEGEANDARNKAMDDAQSAREAAIAARQAALLGTTGQPGQPGQDTGTPGVSQVGQIDMSQPQPAVPLDATAAAPATPTMPTTTPTQNAVAAPTATQAAAAASVPDTATPTADAGGDAATNQPSAQDVVAAGSPTAADLAPKFAAVGLPTSTAPKGNMTPEQARAQAEKDVPDVMDFFNKNIPAITQTYLRQGNIDKANEWQKYAQDAQTQKNMKTWADAYKNMQLGNYEQAGDQIMELYGKYPDGITPVSKEVVKDKDGNVTGFNVKTKIDATGEERNQFISTADMANLGLTALSPPKMFEAAYKAKVAKDAAVAAAQAEAGKQKMKMIADIAVKQVENQGKANVQTMKGTQALDNIAQKAALDAQNQRNLTQQQIDTKVSYLKNAGYPDDFIRNSLPAILGINEYKKQASPEEAARMAMDARIKNDPRFARLPPDEQRKVISSDMAIVQSFGKNGAVAAATSPNSIATPANATPSAPTTPAALATKGLKRYIDNTTGRVVYR